MQLEYYIVNAYFVTAIIMDKRWRIEMVVKSNSDSDSIIYKFERVPSNAGCVDYVGGIDWIL